MKIFYLGIEDTDPNEYIDKYHQYVIFPKEFPDLIKNIKAPQGFVLATESKYIDTLELEGDIFALSYIDLEKEGLQMYKHYVQSGNKSNNSNWSELDLLKFYG